MKVILAYYSWQGHTAKVAQALAGQLGAELVRIEPVSETGMVSKALKAVLRMRSGIKPCRVDLTDADHLVVASPVWAHKVPPYVNEFLSRLTGVQGKPFSVLVEMRDPGQSRPPGSSARHWRRRGCVLSPLPQRWRNRWTTGHSGTGSRPSPG